MNETTIIILIVAGLILSGVFAVYYIGEYVYEWYIEKFTADPDPDNPDVEQHPEIDIWESIDKVITYPAVLREKSERLIGEGIRVIKQRFNGGNTGTTIGDLRERIRRPNGTFSIPTGRPSAPPPRGKKRFKGWSTDEVDRTLDNLGIDPNQTFSTPERESVWDTKKFPKTPRRPDPSQVWDSGLYEGGDEFTRGTPRRTVTVRNREGTFCDKDGCTGRYRVIRGRTNAVICERCRHIRNRRQKVILRPSRGTSDPGPH
jgi:hypothetical protein